MAGTGENTHEEAGVGKPFFSGGSEEVTGSYDAGAIGPGAAIGPFKLLGILGEGGYGIVYLAAQEQPIRRRVALKVIKPGMDSKQVIARFEAERQALALLDHPNIAQIHDAGTTPEGRPYFAMEYIEGLPITEYCDRERLTVKERLQLFLQVCEAVAHAHQKGIIHRDLKPSNMLVTAQNGRPLVKVIDFGIAKALAQPLTAKTLYTEQGQFIGTPDYMSPEQAEMDARGVDTRSDVYSLGVVLYELLTGVLPFDPEALRAGGFEHIRTVIRDEEPRTPSTRLTGLGEESVKIAHRRRTDPQTLRRSLHRELEWIPLKAMRKESSRRYQAVSELADDIENYLKGTPLLAGPESAGYRAKKFVQRHSGVVGAAALITASLLIGLIVSTTMYFKAETMRAVADGSRQDAEVSAEAYRQALYRSYISRAYAEHELGNNASMLNLLERCPADLRDWEWRYLSYVSDESSRTLTGHEHMVMSVAVSPDGTRIASASVDKTIRIWDARNGTELAALQNGDWVHCVAFSPDGTRLVTGDITRRVKVWDVINCRELMSCAYPDDVYGVSFSPDGQQLAAGGHADFVKIWDAHTGKELLVLTGHQEYVTDIAYSLDGARIASASADRTVRIWDAANGALLKTLSGHGACVSSVVFSRDGRHVFSGDFDGRIRKWNASTGDALAVFQGHKGEAASLSYAPGTDLLASAGADCSIRVWDPITGECLTTLRGHTRPIQSVAFCYGGTQLVSGASDATVKLWSLGKATEPRILRGHTTQVQDVVFSPEGRLCVGSAGIGQLPVVSQTDGSLA